MTTTTTQQQQAKADVQVTPDVPVAINTPFATIAVYGHEYLAKRDLEVLALVLNSTEKDPGARSIIFRTDGYPKDQLANCCPDTLGMAINLHGLLNKSMESTIDKPERSVMGEFYMNLIFAYLHEIGHLEPRLIGSVREELDDENSKLDEEGLVDAWATEKLIELAKTHNIEPPLFADSPFLSSEATKIVNSFLGEDDEDYKGWAETQRHMLDNRIFYKLEPSSGDDEQAHNGLTLSNFKVYVALALGQDPDDPEWNAPVNDSPSLAQAIKEVAAENSAPPANPEPTTANANLFVTPEMQEMVDDSDYPFYDGEYEQPAPAMTPNVATTTPMSGPGPALFGQHTGPANPPMATQQQVIPPAPQYPNLGMAPEQVAGIMQSVYMKIYKHVFTSCQWQLNNDVGFCRPEAVAEMAIPLTEQEKSIVVKCDCLDVNGRWCPNMPTAQSGLRGFIARQAKLPMYKLYINDGTGQEVCRILIPQNPAKRKGDGQYTDTALQARAGHAIMYIMEGNDGVVAGGGKKYLFKIVDNQLQQC